MFKVESDQNGALVNFQSQLVAQDFKQDKGVAFNETFSLVRIYFQPQMTSNSLYLRKKFLSGFKTTTNWNFNTKFLEYEKAVWCSMKC